MVTIILKRSVKELKHDDFKNREVLLFLNKGKETIK